MAIAQNTDAPNGPTDLKGISVIIPTLNEAGNLDELIGRLSDTLNGREFELIIIDDDSTDETWKKALDLTKRFPLSAHKKFGQKGKAYSILEGISRAKYDIVAMIDADLQYPPEAVSEMMDAILSGEADMVIADRKAKETTRLRKITSNSFRKVFGGAIWKLDVDVQSGLKVFKREIIQRCNLKPSPWSLDLELLLCARSGGYRLASYNITFAERRAGSTKVKWFSVAKELGFTSLKLRMRPPHFLPFHETMLAREGYGFHYKGEKYVTHTSLTKDDMAVERTGFKQRIIIAAIFALIITAFIVNWYLSLILLISIITTLYFFDLLFNLFLTARSYYQDAEISIDENEIEERDNWPNYTIFCPLYKEWEVIPQFTKAMSDLDYPHDKLEVQLLLEEDDTQTIEKVSQMTLPEYFKIIVVPHGLPKTKPKACNFGLLQATGEYAVIYDAEDVPDPLQLKKAVMAFSKAGADVGCIQAKLNYYNWNQNLLTRLFTLEYSLWFNLVLTGLQTIGAPIPLGGTSNHFRVADLRQFEGWDPFNVTEDADLGMRIAKKGMRTAILDSYTLEEANSEFFNWLKQRSRWIKGYMQTYLVHMRKPSTFAVHKNSHLFFMQLVIGGKVASMLINPFLWLLTLTYFLAPENISEFIKSLYLTPVFYMGIIALVFGNFLYLYYYMMGAAKQGRPELIIYALFVPFYWLMMSWAAFLALRDLIVRPHHWHKTKHGLHLKAQSVLSEQELTPEMT